MKPLTWVEIIALGNRYNWPGSHDSDIGKLLETLVFLTDPSKADVMVSRQYTREVRALLHMPPDPLAFLDEDLTDEERARAGE